ncbi:Mu transposase C-terminal domain-containing protein [Iodobacter fluviatilis]|uniref:Integrase catalytic domain-containing protein n=1 Tax=Iodobacter fluviatilis TaxID=537 RepID=A0A7G3G619_9NEIS|nr:DDE-type integrase/transposase/recombinase [Iodobacter fluviatilis]QBC42592.1 hypothetical protein C1H71_02825 [Iodobacter fluviatilis]
MKPRYYSPKVGLRFHMHGCEFEVTYIYAGIVRYAAAIGGKAFRISHDRFIEMQESETLLIKNQDIEGISENGCSGKLSELSEKETRAAIRMRRYVDSAVTQLVYPTSKKHLTALIPLIAFELEDQQPPDPRTVASWIKRYFLEGRDGALLSLRHKQSGNRGLRFCPQVEILIEEAIQQVFLQSERRDAKDVRTHIVGKLSELGLLSKHSSTVTVPSLRTLQRRIKALDPYIVALAKKGKVAADRVARAAGRAIISPRPMYLVQIDTHYLDILLRDPDSGDVIGRPYLVCILDVYTRAVVGIYISMFPPSAVTTLAAVKNMLTRLGMGLPGGIPVRIVPDNGVEFKNSAFIRLCARLGIIVTPAEIRDPNDKAHIESFFRTLTTLLVQKCAGTTFSSPSDRGEYDSRSRAASILEKMHEYCLEWINEVYHTSIHSRTGRAPILAWEDSVKGWPAPIVDIAEIDAIARLPVQRNIHKGRVLVDGIEYFSHALATLEAIGDKRVIVLVDELNLHEVYIEHPSQPSTLILAESTNPEYTIGLTQYEHQEAKKIKAALTASDQKRLGIYCDLLARWTLFQKIQTDSEMAQRQIARLTNGKGRARTLPKIVHPLPDVLELNVVPADVPSFESGAVSSSGDYEIMEIDL